MSMSCSSSTTAPPLSPEASTNKPSIPIKKKLKFTNCKSILKVIFFNLAIRPLYALTEGISKSDINIEHVVPISYITAENCKYLLVNMIPSFKEENSLRGDVHLGTYKPNARDAGMMYRIYKFMYEVHGNVINSQPDWKLIEDLHKTPPSIEECAYFHFVISLEDPVNYKSNSDLINVLWPLDLSQSENIHSVWSLMGEKFGKIHYITMKQGKSLSGTSRK